MDCSPRGSSVHGISQARSLEWVAISFSRGSSQPRVWAYLSCLEGGFFTPKPPGKPNKEDRSQQKELQGHQYSRWNERGAELRQQWPDREGPSWRLTDLKLQDVGADHGALSQGVVVPWWGVISWLFITKTENPRTLCLGTHEYYEFLLEHIEVEGHGRLWPGDDLLPSQCLQIMSTVKRLWESSTGCTQWSLGHEEDHAGMVC